jgi:DNA-binding IclR family transcriptional regulator
MAGLRAPALDALLARPRAARTDKTVVDEDLLRARLRKTRRTGYAFEDEECDEGTRSVAAPIHSADGRVIAAVGIAGPRDRIRKSAFSELGPVVVEAAQKISERLGYARRQPIYV